MNKWINQKISGLYFRWRNLGYGILFFSSSGFKVPKRLFVRGKFRTFLFLFRNTEAFYYEFREICIEDCYLLGQIKNKITVKSIVDIGANQGLFVLAARKTWGDAVIQAYEPNPQLSDALANNASACQAVVFQEAVSDQDGKMSLQFGETDLQTMAYKSDAGNVKATAFSKVIARAGGTIDLLKLDCEGGEWPLLDQTHPWKDIRSVTMEYHLWARPGMTLVALEKRINELGFTIIHKSILTDQFGILTAIKD